jgi:glucokinase
LIVPSHAIGVDIGGTTTKLAVVDTDGTVCLRDSAATPRGASPEAIIAGIVEMVRAFRQKAETVGFSEAGIGIAVPQFFEGEDWVQRQANNMQALEGIALRPPLVEALGPSVALIHDLNAIGIAEHRFGRGRSSERMLLMAVGTGISISFVTRERGLEHWSYGGEGDAGMIIVDPRGTVGCSGGGRGCLEAVASGMAIRRRALEEVERGRITRLAEVLQRQGDLTARDVAETARAGDAAALDILDQAGQFLGVALTSYLHIFRPDLIVLAGGVAQAGELLIGSIRRTVDRLASPSYLNHLTGIEVSALGTDGGAIGAASLILSPGKVVC